MVSSISNKTYTFHSIVDVAMVTRNLLLCSDHTPSNQVRILAMTVTGLSSSDIAACLDCSSPSGFPFQHFLSGAWSAFLVHEQFMVLIIHALQFISIDRLHSCQTLNLRANNNKHII